MNEQTPSARHFLLGTLAAMAAMTIFAGWNIASRAGTTSDLSVYDIAFFRFGVSGLIALPFFIRALPVYRRIPFGYLAAMILGNGAFYVVMANFGFMDAPASHGTLIPGVMLLCVAVMSAFWLNESFNRYRLVGYVLIAATVAYRLISHSEGAAYLLADGFFIFAGFVWACYTVVNKKTGITPLQAMALVTTGSLITFCLPYAAFNLDHLTSLPLMPSLVQMIYQGVIVGLIGFYCYNKAIALIGPSRASAFAAIIPLLTVLMAMPLLGEYPVAGDWVFVMLLSLGVLLSTGIARRVLKR